MATTLQYKTVTIRKPHKCYLCFRKFEPGTKMVYWAGIFEGDFSSVYSCNTCQQIMSFTDETEYYEGDVYEMLKKGQTPEELLTEFTIKK